MNTNVMIAVRLKDNRDNWDPMIYRFNKFEQVL